MNEVVLIGRLTKDPELNTTKEGSDKARITIAVNRNFKDKDGNYNTDFFEILLWNNMAKRTSEWCKKGDCIGVRARLQNRNYIDKNGNKVYKNEIITESLSFISSSRKKEKAEENVQQTINKENDPFKDFGEQYDIDDSQLPF